MHEYSGEKTLYHFDMYRINDIDSLYSTGFFDLMDGKAIIATEWSENIPFALPKSYYKVTLKYGENEDERIITIDLVEEKVK
jgi:tRNA threonylcarbamoyladenosine biosynthesis protein TsaE